MKNNKSELRKRTKKGFSKKLKIVPKINLNVPENSTENIKIKFPRKIN
jgi:hypothetical protein